MVDYNDVVKTPYYRNLVVNPSAETVLADTWRSTNGTISPSTTYHLNGTGSYRYIVDKSTSENYSFGPIGPAGNVHVTRFKISPTGTASAKFYVKSPSDIWVQLRFVWYAKSWPNGTSQAPVLTKISGETVTVDTVKLADTDGWKKLYGRVTNPPAGATHFQPLVMVYGSGGAEPSRPANGASVWVDEAFVPDNGANIDTVNTVIGGVAGAYWEGTPNNSTSNNKPLPDGPPVVDPPPPNGGDQDPDDGGADSPDGEDTDSGANPDYPDEPVDQSPTVPPSSNPNGLPPWGGSNGTATVEDLPPDAGIPNPRAIVLAEQASTWRGNNRDYRLNRDIQISNLVLNSVDSNGVTWIVNDIDGWWTMPEPDVPDQARSWFDGSFETRGRFPARTFTLTGCFIPGSPTQLAAARDRLIRAVNLVHKGGWFMTHEDPVRMTATKGSKVWMVGQPLIATTSMSGKTDFSIAFRAPDPIKYGIKDGIPPGWNMIRLQTSDAIFPKRPYPREYPWGYPAASYGAADTVAINYGNAVVFPTLRMRGPTNGAVRIMNSTTGQVLRITRQLHVGEELVIDCFTKQVTMNGGGNFRFYLDIDVDWLMLQPGENKLSFRQEELDSNTTTLEVLYRSGWIA